MPSELKGRLVEIIVQDKKLSGLSVEFRIDRNLDATQNTADFSIFNLSPEHRKFLQELGRPIVQFKAGYAGSPPPLIFLGKLREVTNLREGADWITRISSGDGDTAKKKTVSFSLGPGADFATAVKKVIGALGVGVGNAAQAIATGKFSEVGKDLTSGISVHGNASDELGRLLKGAGLGHSIQNGVLQVLPIGGSTAQQAVLLKPSTGLVGSPEMGEKGTIKVRSLLNAEIAPGRQIRVESDAISAFYVVKRAVYVGGTNINDYYVDIEGYPPGQGAPKTIKVPKKKVG